MTNTIEQAELINKYLCSIKKSLPLSIRLKKDELNDILDEIEEHIWEKVIESIGDRDPTEIDIQIAISQIGEPFEIACKFSSKSTPYIFISEELYPSYKKCRKIIYWSFFLWLAIYFIPHPFGSFYLYQLTELPLYDSILTALIISISSLIFIGIIFANLSSTGYIPYDIRKSKLKKDYSKITQLHRLKFKSNFQISISVLQISLFFNIATFLLFFRLFYQAIPFFLFSIIKFLRGFIKRKSLIWQKILILFDIFVISWIFHIVGELVNSNYHEFQGIFNILPFLLIFYTFYELYLFTTLSEKIDLFLKELSIVKRINKKESIFNHIKNENIVNNQYTSNNSNTFSLEIEEKIKNYLKKVKRNLPFWFKLLEKTEAVNELEEEIRESIMVLEESNKLDNKNLDKLFFEFGNIKKKLSDYRQISNPRIFISKETWPLYLKSLEASLTYFVILGILIIVLLRSFGLSFNPIGIIWISRILILLWIITPILITKFFVFLSLNGFNPEKKELILPEKKINYRYFIWESLFATIYLVIGLVIYFDQIISGEIFTNLSTFILMLLNISLLLLLAGLKALKIVLKKYNLAFKSFLIVISLSLSLVINFFVLYNYHSNFFIIRSYISVNLFSFLFLPINIEIIYEIFQLFLKTKKKE